MSLENKFAAEMYHRLYPWIDHNVDVKFCLDDGGKSKSATPDLCFSFLGGSKPMRIEFKMMHTNGKVRVFKKQFQTWNGQNNQDAPYLWIAKRIEAEEYFLWPHSNTGFQSTFSASALNFPAGTELKSELIGPLSFPPLTMPRLWCELWTYAAQNGFIA